MKKVSLSELQETAVGVEITVKQLGGNVTMFLTDCDKDLPFAADHTQLTSENIRAVSNKTAK